MFGGSLLGAQTTSVNDLYRCFRNGIAFHSILLGLKAYRCSADVYEYERIVPQTELQPSPRSLHAAAALPSGQKLYIFGGKDGQGTPLNDLWCFDLGT